MCNNINVARNNNMGKVSHYVAVEDGWSVGGCEICVGVVGGRGGSFAPQIQTKARWKGERFKLAKKYVLINLICSVLNVSKINFVDI